MKRTLRCIKDGRTSETRISHGWVKEESRNSNSKPMEDRALKAYHIDHIGRLSLTNKNCIVALAFGITFYKSLANKVSEKFLISEATK